MANATLTRSDTRCRTICPSPLGTLVLEGDDHSLFRLYLPNTGMARAVTAGGEGTEPLRAAAAQLDEYFAGRRTVFDLPLAPQGTAFQMSVWWALADISFGEVITYGELATWVGKPSAPRAVGQAMGANPLAIVLACHRVVAAGGGIGGYGGGLPAKRMLLALEGRGNY